MTEAEWLARIAAAPMDYELRRVFADWLIEQGDPRGEFIALECRVIAEPDHEDVSKWKRRATTIRKAHAEAWWGGDHVTRGGFIEEARASSPRDFDQLAVIAPALARIEMRTHSVQPPGDHPLWARIRHIDALGYATYGVIDAMKAGSLARLESLRATHQRAEDCAKLIAALEHAPTITRLELVKLADGTALRRLPMLPLRYLDLYDTPIDADTAAHLAKLLGNVVELSLGATGIGVEGLAILASANLGAVERLDLRRAISKKTPAADTLRALAAATPRLRSLELMGARMTDDLGVLANWKHLEEVSLQGCDLDDISALPRGLVALNLRSNKLVDISPLTAMKKLQLVNLESNPLSEKSKTLLEKSKQLANVTITAGKLPSQLFSEPRNDKHGFWLGSTNYREKNVIRRP